MGAEPNPATVRAGEHPVERRERRPVRLHALVMRSDRSTVDVSLLDLSYEGCGIETPIEFSAGETIKLSVLRRGGLDAHVRWYKDGRAGLVFAPEKVAERKHFPRQSERTALSADVSLRRVGQNSYRVRVSDLSPDGCKVDLVERPRLEERLLIKLDGLEVLEAQVCWVEGYMAGLRFEKTIHPAVFDLLLQRLR